MVLGYIEYTISHDDAFRFLPQLQAARQNSPLVHRNTDPHRPGERNLNSLAGLYAQVHGLIPVPCNWLYSSQAKPEAFEVVPLLSYLSLTGKSP